MGLWVLKTGPLFSTKYDGTLCKPRYDRCIDSKAKGSVLYVVVDLR